MHHFPFQRNVTFKSHGPLAPQIGLHLLTTIAIFLVMDLFTCVWNPVTNALIINAALCNTIQSIVTTVVVGCVAMIIIFAVDKKIFARGFGEKKRKFWTVKVFKLGESMQLKRLLLNKRGDPHNETDISCRS